jgi:hypothetical protein
MAWAEAWQKTKYQQLPMMELAGLAPWLHQNPDLFLNYKQKKSNHQDKRRWIIKVKEVRSLQTTWIGTLTTHRWVMRATLLSSSTSSCSTTKVPSEQTKNSGEKRNQNRKAKEDQ